MKYWYCFSESGTHKKSDSCGWKLYRILYFRDVNDTAPGAPAGFDVLDARGTFDKHEARKELMRLNRSELEGNLGVSSHKVDEILNRAEKKSRQKYTKLPSGQIKYKVFLGKSLVW